MVGPNSTARARYPSPALGILDPRARDLGPPKGVFAPPPFYGRTTVRRMLLPLIAVLAGVAWPIHAADAAVVTKRDTDGRQIHLDVRAPEVDVEWYAGLLRSAAHGPEIESVVVRIVPWDAIGRACGDDAVACYTETPDAGGLIVVPAGKGRSVAHALLH